MAKPSLTHRGKASRPAPRSSASYHRDFESFFELSGVGHVVSDVDNHRFLRVNETFRKMTGYTSDELSDMTAFDLTHPEDQERDRLGWSNCVTQGLSHFEIEKRYVRKDGRQVWVNVTSTIVRDDDGTAIRAIGVIRDIDEQRRSIEETARIQGSLEQRVEERTRNLEQTNQTLLTLIDASPLAIVGLDAAHHVTMWNRRAEELFGWQEEEMLGRPLDLAGDTQAEKTMAELLDTQAPFSLESFRRRRDGTPMEVRVWYAPTFTPDNEFAGHVGLLMDLAETRFLESALLEAGEREQRRLGQDLHEHLCQHLLGAAFAAKALSGNQTLAPASTQLDDLARNINEAVVQMRDIARGLHPVDLEADGLMSSLGEMAQRLSRTMPCTFTCRRAVPLEHPKTALQAYRIAQEAVSILSHHFQAQGLHISLAKKNGRITLVVEGHDPARESGDVPEAFMDRKIIEYRAKSIGGSLTIETLPKLVKITCQFSAANHEH